MPAVTVGQLSDAELEELGQLRANVDVAQQRATEAQVMLSQEQTLLQAFLIRIQRGRGLHDGDQIAPDGRILRAAQFNGAGDEGARG
jgi:hypothetical protein